VNICFERINGQGRKLLYRLEFAIKGVIYMFETAYFLLITENNLKLE